MNKQSEPFQFEISLSVLNHLGRNLYRNFITVLGEAISNAWDADAKNVWIFIDKDENNFIIKDDGCGMTHDDFKGKFLKVGYSKRKNGDLKSSDGRPFIGAKGIGKLALLSCASEISIISKTSSTSYVGGVINNMDLDNAIENDKTPDKYPLQDFEIETFSEYINGHNNGTIVRFIEMKEGIKNTIPYLKSLIALYFRFSLIDSSFNIYINDELITLDDLKDLAENTEFVWNINNLVDPYINKHLTQLKESEGLDIRNTSMNGFIASVNKPGQLKIKGAEEKAGVDLFVNGRLREKNILRHLPDFLTRWVASYIYGQIHFDELDDDMYDKTFTSSREGVVEDNEKYNKLLNILKTEILEYISDKWDEWRIKYNEEGDIENKRLPKYKRRAEESKNWREKDFRKKIDETISDKKVGYKLKDKLKDLSEKNTIIYQDLFILENLFREYIKIKKIEEKDFILTNKDEKEVIDSIKRIRGRRKNDEELHPLEGKIVKQEHYLNYTDLYYLSEIIDLKIMNKGHRKKFHGKMVKNTNDIGPVRNPIMHTNEITIEALEWDKIGKLIDHMDKLK